MKTHEPKMSHETPTPTTTKPARRPYAPPAIEQEHTLEVVTLGTSGPKLQNPHLGC